jgi:hypothetical protein
VKSLDISDCKLLTHIGDLIKAESVEVASLLSLEDFSFLEKVTSKAVIKNCPKFVKKKYISVLKALPEYIVI